MPFTHQQSDKNVCISIMIIKTQKNIFLTEMDILHKRIHFISW